MWIVELAFTPDPARLAARPAHRAVLTALHEDGRLRMAGPFADDSGALIVLDVAGRDELDALLAADPYFATPGVTVVRTQEWAPFLT
ncbi:hypothetical protein KOI35_13275 [Actinoplanes bogorensis]|uniref:YCII-related domain-containing protein n=1 Tax=Paractinoplanes bogorensis TaxID=1610840 RepID=A0ABS5YLY0_9ACTN|nr:YciI family protein [Actinoplanes bogorensis]MBU2664468.1 hypothetical protein [Actinoplanes bogorensis]